MITGMKLQIDIEPGVKRALRMRAADKGQTLSAITQQALMDFLGVDRDGEPVSDTPDEPTTAKPKAK